MEKIEVEICRECHPFYTGTDKLLDIAGRVEKFKQRAAAAKPLVKKVKKVRVEEVADSSKEK